MRTPGEDPADLLADLTPVLPRHQHVEQGEPDRAGMPAKRLDRRLAVRRLDDRVAGVPEHGREQFANDRLVLGQEHGLGPPARVRRRLAHGLDPARWSAAAGF